MYKSRGLLIKSVFTNKNGEKTDRFAEIFGIDLQCGAGYVIMDKKQQGEIVYVLCKSRALFQDAL